MDKVSLAVFVVFVASMVVVGRLARESGRKSLPWVSTASVIGPLAIVLLYLADAASALKKMINAQRS